MKISAAFALPIVILAPMIASLPASAAASNIATVRQTASFDADWRFLKSDVPGAEKPAFTDATWRRLNVPHDWSIEGPIDQTNKTGGAGAFLPGGVGFYRKSFTLPTSSQRKRVFIEFDGVMANSDVWINGVHLGKRPFGYVSFRYEMTPHLKFGNAAPNVLAVRTDNLGQPASRWYTGAGIYRHVRLITTGPVHLEKWATFVTTPSVAANRATVRVQSSVVNQSAAPRSVALQVTLLDSAGKTVGSGQTAAQMVAAGQSVRFERDVLVDNPRLWSIENPSLYRVVARVRAGNTTLDDEIVTTGIREARFEAATGFWLNGRNLKIKGVCLHHDAGALGAAVPLRAWERRLQTLKQIGVNGIRTAHNPMSPEFLDLCDRMGFVVMNELFDQWTGAKNPFDYHLNFKEWANIDVRDTVLRDRNHPSVIIYSAGNEIRDTPQVELAKGILTSLVATFHEFDSTRPVTQALFRPNVSHDYENGLADILDVVGQNYRENEILAAHAQKPTRKIIGTENGHDRRIWLALRDNPQYAGQFLWAGIDYLGEARTWPNIASQFGLLDRTGAKRPLAFERQSWWSDQPMVYMTRRTARSRVTATDPGYEATAAAVQRPVPPLVSDWTPPSLEAHEENVEVYSNVQSVELFLNGKSLGAKLRPADDSPRNWQVPFEPGVLRAVATSGSQVVATHELRTAGKATRIALATDRARLSPDFDDVAYVSASVVDANGVFISSASDLISFQISGPGTVVAVDNGDNATNEPFQAMQRRAYLGSCIAVLKANAPKGRITFTASAPGLQTASISIEAAQNPIGVQ